MATLFDLEDEQQSVRHKSEKGLVKSKGLTRSNRNRPPNNRLLALEQSFSSPALSSAYEVQPAPLSIPTKLYLIAGGGDWTKFGVQTREALKSLQKDMVYLLPEFWVANKKKPASKIIEARCSTIKTEIEKGIMSDSDPSTAKLFLNGSFISQLLFWAAVLKESIDEVFHYSSYIDDSNAFKQMIKKGMDKSIKTQVNPLFKPKISELSTLKIPPEFFSELTEKVKRELVSKQLVSALKKIKLEETLTLNPLMVKDLDKDFQMHKMHETSLAYQVAERETGLVVSPADRERFRKEQKDLALLAENSSFVAIGKPSNKINQDIASSLKSILGLALTIPKDHHYSKASIAKLNENKERAVKILTQLQLALGSLAYCDTQGDLKLDHEKLNKTQKFLKEENSDGLVSTLVATIDASVGTWDGKKFAVTGNQLQNFNTSHTTQNFLTTSNFGDWIPAFITISGFVYKIGRKDWEGLKKQLTVEHPVSATAAVLGKIKQGLGATAAVYGLAEKYKVIGKSAEAAKHIGNVSKVSGITGIVLGVVELGFVAKDINNIHNLETRFKTLIAKDTKGGLKGILNGKVSTGVKRHRVQDPRYKAFDKILQKYGHRTHYKVISGVGAVASIAAGSLTTAIAFGAAVGLANIWNPVGWVCVGAALVTGVGLLSYKGVKRITYKKHKLGKLKKEFRDVPAFCKTSGDYWRYKAATTIFIAATMEDGDVLLLGDELKKDIAVGRAFAIVLFGAAIKNDAKPQERKQASEKAYQTAAQMGIPGIMAFIKG
ncbi:MAG: hypothetical protein ACR2P1_14420 [Pseudomonadales bacterium]